MIEIDRHPVDSSLIKSAGYDRDTRVCEIEFVSKSGPGPVYRYHEMRQQDYDDFRAANSKGRFFLKKIKGKFPFEKVLKS